MSLLLRLLSVMFLDDFSGNCMGNGLEGKNLKKGPVAVLQVGGI